MTESIAAEFEEFPKIARLSRDCLITEKIDGTNAQVWISDDLGEVRAGSRSRWLTPMQDNYGFAYWVEKNREELLRLGPGRHFGEWWGSGIQRNYGLADRRFSLFNVLRWRERQIPSCCSLVPTLYEGPFSTEVISGVLADLGRNGSRAAPGFGTPEGIVVLHKAAGVLFKKTLLRDEEPKGARGRAA